MFYVLHISIDLISATLTTITALRLYTSKNFRQGIPEILRSEY